VSAALSPRRDPSLTVRRRNSGRYEHDGADLSIQGLYYVLMGRISPLDGVGPRELGLIQLMTGAGWCGAGSDSGHQLYQ
jgi:recombination protein RecR